MTLADPSTGREQIYNAALALHNVGIEHNDLEPRNILLDQCGDIHIIDFHLSTAGHHCGGLIECLELQLLAERLGMV